jgi:hypothetical protein
MILQSTKKLQTWLKQTPVPLPEEADPMQCWHANLFKIERANCLLFTHNLSRYSIFSYGVTKRDIPGLYEQLHLRTTHHLRCAGLNDAAIARLLGSPQETIVTSTSDRKVMGTMNQFTQVLEYRHYYEKFVDDDHATNWLNHQYLCTIVDPIPKGYYHPVEALRLVLEGGV